MGLLIGNGIFNGVRQGSNTSITPATLNAVFWIKNFDNIVGGYFVDSSVNGKQIAAATTNSANDSLILPASDSVVIAAVTASGAYSTFYTTDSTPKTVLIKNLIPNCRNVMFYNFSAMSNFCLFPARITGNDLISISNYIYDQNNTDVNYPDAIRINSLQNSMLSPYLTIVSGGTLVSSNAEFITDVPSSSLSYYRISANKTSTPLKLSTRFRKSTLLGPAGASYTLGVSIRQTVGTALTPTIFIIKYNSEGSYLGIIETSIKTVLSTVFRDFTVSFSLPSDAFYYAVVLDFNSAVNEAVTLDVSNMFIVDSSLYTSGNKFISYNDVCTINSAFYSKKLAALGDSITISGGTTDEFPLNLIKTLGINFYNYKNYGVTGYFLTGNESANSLNKEVNTMIAAGFIPDIILIALGTNDAANARVVGDFDTTLATTPSACNRDEIYGAVRYNVDRIRSNFPSVKIIYLLPCQRNDSANEAISGTYTPAIKRICDAMIVPYIDLFNCGITKANQANYLTDGLHPNSDGRWRIGMYVADQMIKRML